MEESVERQLVHHRQENEVLRKQLSEVSFKKTTELNALRSKLVKLETDFSISCAELSASTNENVLLRQQASQLVLTHNSEKANLRSSLKELEDRISIKNKTIDSLSLENEKQKKESVSFKYTKTQELHLSALKVTELETIIAVVRNETSKNVDEISKLLDEINKEREALKALLFELSSIAKDHHADIITVSKDLLTVNNKIEAGSRDIATRFEHFHSIGGENTELFNTINKLTNENNELSMKLNKTNKKLNSNILKLQNDLIVKNNEIMTLNSTISEQASSLRALEQSSTLKYSHLENLYEALRAQQQEYVSKFKADSLAVRSDADALIVENTEKQKLIGDLQLDISSWRDKHGSAQRQIQLLNEEASITYQRHLKEVDELADTVQQLRSTLQDITLTSQKREEELVFQVNSLQESNDTTATELTLTKDLLTLRSTDLETLTQQHVDLEEKHVVLSEDHQECIQKCSEILKSLEESEDECQQQQTDYENQIAKLQEEMSELVASRDALTIQYNNLEVNFNAVIEENNAHTSMISELNTEIETMQDKLQSLSLTKQQADQTISCQITALNETIASLHNEKYELDSQVKTLQGEIFDVESKYAAVLQAHKAALIKMEDLERTIKEKNREIQLLQQELSSSNESLSNAKNSIETLENELVVANGKIEEVTASMNSRTVKYKATQSKVVDLEKSLAEVRKNLKLSFDGNQLEVKGITSQLTTAQEQLISQKEAYEKEVKNLKDELIAKEYKILDLSDQLSKSAHMVTQLECGLVELRDVGQEEQSGLLATINTLESENQSLSLQLSEQATQLNEIQIENEELNNQLVETKFKLDGLHTDINLHLVTIKQLEEQIKSITASKVELQGTIEATKVEVSNGVTQVSEKQALITKLEAELTQCLHNNSTLAEDLQTAQGAIVEKLQLIDHLEKTLQTLQTAAQSTIENQAQLIDSLESKHASFQETFTALNKQLQAKENELKILQHTYNDVKNVNEVRCGDLTSRIQSQSEDLSNLGAKHSELIALCESLTEGNGKKESEISALRITQIELNNSLSVLSSAKLVLEKQISTQQDEILKLTETLQSTLTAHTQELQTLSQQQVAMVNKLSVKLNHRNDAIKVLKAEISRLKDVKRADQKDIASMLNGLQSEFNALHLQIAEFNSEPNSVNSSVDLTGNLSSLINGNNTEAPLPSPPRSTKNSKGNSSNGVADSNNTSVNSAPKSPMRVKVELLPSL